MSSESELTGQQALTCGSALERGKRGGQSRARHSYWVQDTEMRTLKVAITKILNTEYWRKERNIEEEL